mmetsp:Transcript_50870/g.118833  ORF Transcript_50870/g.118833 Transcript_50870/m.118833 type:complete len:101 (+) Transcript_50870:50-352(+)
MHPIRLKPCLWRLDMGNSFDSWDSFFASVNDPLLRALTPTDMDAFNVSLPLKAFLRRALRVIVTFDAAANLERCSRSLEQNSILICRFHSKGVAPGLDCC